jgi:hypothetical protein
VPEMPVGFSRKSSGTSTEKYPYAVAVPSVQCAAVRTIVGEMRVPEHRCMYSPSES